VEPPKSCYGRIGKQTSPRVCSECNNCADHFEDKGQNEKRTALIKKKLPKYFLMLIGIILLLNAVLMALVSNFNVGLVFLGILSVIFLVYGLLWNKVKKAKWLHILAAFACLVLIAFSTFLFLYGNNDTVEYDEDVVIILGASVHGEEVSGMLAKRLDKAIDYYAENPNVLFIVSGGRGPQEAITEALAMERYLIEHGIPAAQIIREEYSTSTYENFSFSGDLLEKEFPQGCLVAFITNDFHVYRAEHIAQYAGISAHRHMGATSEWYAVPATYLREMAAVLQFWFFPPEPLKVS
jgi:uncharacterized SAM-binding protein YcdF (DUF218 family)